MRIKKDSWSSKACCYLSQLLSNELGRSHLDSEVSLYGTVYSHLGMFYLSCSRIEAGIGGELVNFLLCSQGSESGLLVGPEVEKFDKNARKVTHDYTHLALHSTCSSLPLYQLCGLELKSIVYAQRFCDSQYLENWLSERDWRNAWLEGNNILFVGQLLVYLRDIEGIETAQAALDRWFQWLEEELDPETSLWGTNGYCDVASAVYGGYHQLLVYWHEDRPIRNPQGLVDSVLSLRHSDGGFNPHGNGGACEDVDSVDILVHAFKRWDYRRVEIRSALWCCVDHILATQNADGGFPYNRDKPQSHMGIPGTQAKPNQSCTFPTWFRIHTLALCAEIIPDHPQLAGIKFRFNKHLSMGWHKSPPGWNLEISDEDRRESDQLISTWSAARIQHERKRMWRKRVNRIKKRVSHLLRG